MTYNCMMHQDLQRYRGKAVESLSSGGAVFSQHNLSALPIQQPASAQQPVTWCHRQPGVSYSIRIAGASSRRGLLLGAAAFGASLLPTVLCSPAGSRSLHHSDRLAMLSSNQEQLTRRLQDDGLIRTSRCGVYSLELRFASRLMPSYVSSCMIIWSVAQMQDTLCTSRNDLHRF